MEKVQVNFKGCGQTTNRIIKVTDLNIKHETMSKNDINLNRSHDLESIENPLLSGVESGIAYSESSAHINNWSENKSSLSLCADDDGKIYLPHGGGDGAIIYFKKMPPETTETKECPRDFTNQDCRDDIDQFSFFSISRKHKLLLLMMGFANFCAAVCFSILGPFFPEEAGKKGVSQTVIGLIFGVFELVSFLSCPVYGNFMTKIGSKFMFISGIMVSGSCTILFGVLYLSPPGNQFVTICFLCRILEALAAAAFVTSSFTILANAFPQYVATVIGYLEMFTGFGMMAGPAIGGALYSVGGYGLPFYVTGGSMVFCGVLCYFLMPGAHATHHRSSKSILHLMRSPLALITGLCIFSVTYSVGSLEATLARHLLKLDLSTVGVSTVFLVAPGLYALTSPVWGWISDTKGHVKTLIVVGDLLSALMFLMIGPSPLFPFLPKVLWFAIISLIGMGIFLGCASIPLITALVHGTRQLGMPDDLDTFSIVSGYFNSCYSLGAFVGSMTGGAFVDNHGFGWASSFSAGLLVLSAVALISYSAVQKKQSIYLLLNKKYFKQFQGRQHGDIEMLCKNNGSSTQDTS